ncbi:hypothetical protein GQ43DRAFT_402757 [Delitschia confertaspora ATCC 74209]|uniref:Potassium channel tetramerisation-type BTB domain-containing protein n=1 Tax=Delitschia confertaspora ATCC 74209 TaxID=1513339 RepID=A0A9P4MV23_9PLEO|nr:hypothetical protein GQ43DRAFT_402757 [Delitschia confertaspora ATCC 74209]
MPQEAPETSSRDFAFPSTDQAGRAEHSTTTNYLSRSSDCHDDISNTHFANHLSLHEISLNRPNYTTQQSPGHGTKPEGQFPIDFEDNSQAPLAWDWNSSVEFPDFTSHYEPQGELIKEAQDHTIPKDFCIPVTNQDSIQKPHPVPSHHPTPTQNSLSPPQELPAMTSIQTGMKRKAYGSEPSSAVSQGVSFSSELQPPAAKRTLHSDTSSVASTSSPAIASIEITNTATTRPAPGMQSNPAINSEAQRRKEARKGTGPAGRVIDVSKPRKIVEVPDGADVLPAGKVFPIQIGSELFRLSGASISSDAPSYFSNFFLEQLKFQQDSHHPSEIRTLYIDRDPATFRDISLHLQGYHVKPRNGEHFVRLFADAQFYSLPRLIKHLYATDIFIRIGQRDFQLPRDLFSAPGDSPNFFTLGFAHFFTSPAQVFPGLDRASLLRPPIIKPPEVPGRSGDVFADLIRLMQGYDVEIRGEGHRNELLRDARWFHLKGLEQRLIPYNISHNLARGCSEIVIRLDDIRQSGVSFIRDTTTSDESGTGSGEGLLSPEVRSPAKSKEEQRRGGGTISYARPYTEDPANTYHLILETSGSESATLHFPSPSPSVSPSTTPSLTLRATFHAPALNRITSLFSVIASKMGLPATQPLGLMMMASGGGIAAQPASPANSGVSGRRVRVRWEEDAEVILDGQSVGLGVFNKEGDEENQDGSVGVRFEDGKGEWVWGGDKNEEEEREEQWTVKRAQWRIRVEPVSRDVMDPARRMQVVLCIVRVEAVRSQRVRNRQRGFLGS